MCRSWARRWCVHGVPPALWSRAGASCGPWVRGQGLVVLVAAVRSSHGIGSTRAEDPKCNDQRCLAWRRRIQLRRIDYVSAIQFGQEDRSKLEPRPAISALSCSKWVKSEPAYGGREPAVEGLVSAREVACANNFKGVLVVLPLVSCCLQSRVVFAQNITLVLRGNQLPVAFNGGLARFYSPYSMYISNAFRRSILTPQVIASMLYTLSLS